MSEPSLDIWRNIIVLVSYYHHLTNHPTELLSSIGRLSSISPILVVAGCDLAVVLDSDGDTLGM